MAAKWYGAGPNVAGVRGRGDLHGLHDGVDGEGLLKPAAALPARSSDDADDVRPSASDSPFLSWRGAIGRDGEAGRAVVSVD